MDGSIVRLPYFCLPPPFGEEVMAMRRGVTLAARGGDCVMPGMRLLAQAGSNGRCTKAQHVHCGGGHWIAGNEDLPQRQLGACGGSPPTPT